MAWQYPLRIETPHRGICHGGIVQAVTQKSSSERCFWMPRWHATGEQFELVPGVTGPRWNLSSHASWCWSVIEHHRIWQWAQITAQIPRLSSSVDLVWTRWATAECKGSIQAYATVDLVWTGSGSKRGSPNSPHETDSGLTGLKDLFHGYWPIWNAGHL